MLKQSLAGLMALLPLTATAQVVTECDWLGDARLIVEPWEEHTRSFANGNIRVAWIDTGGEPVCCSSHLMVLSPSGNGQDGPAYRQCRMVSAQPFSGFYWVDMPGISASYDPARGLLLSVPVGHWHVGMENGADPIWGRVEVRINQANGAVTIE